MIGAGKKSTAIASTKSARLPTQRTAAKVGTERRGRVRSTAATNKKTPGMGRALLKWSGTLPQG